MARILIVGGSLGGLFAAAILLREGHDVLVLEKAVGSLDGRGAGIVTHAPLIAGLRRAGAVIDDTLGVQVALRVLLERDGSVAATLAMPQLLTSWSRLYQLLRDTLPAKNGLHGVTVNSVSETRDGVMVQTTDGTRFYGDMLVASDGLRSVVRAQLVPTVQPVYAGYIAWRGVCDEAVLSSPTRESAFSCFAFGLPAGEQILGYPVAGTGNTTVPGKRRFNFVWYRAASESTELVTLMTDADGKFYPLGIPPHKVASHHIAAMREAARRLLAPQFVEILEKTAQPFMQPIFDVSSERIAFGRMALMGDAAFVARPHVGMGVTKAAQDAMALADCVASHGAGAAAVTAYEHIRLQAGQAIVQRGRDLGAYMQAQQQHAFVADSTVTRNDAAVLRETAIDPHAALI